MANLDGVSQGLANASNLVASPFLPGLRLGEQIVILGLNNLSLNKLPCL